MPNTYTQIYVHIVFTVQGRHNVIPKGCREELNMYIAGIIRNKKQKLIAINSMPDHIHIFIGLKPSVALSDLVRDIKNNSSAFINKKQWIQGKFSWQTGFGAFSYGHSQMDSVVKYIQNQENHHARKTFKEEYREMLSKFAVEYDAKFLFHEDEK